MEISLGSSEELAVEFLFGVDRLFAEIFLLGNLAFWEISFEGKPFASHLASAHARPGRGRQVLEEGKSRRIVGRRRLSGDGWVGAL